MKLHTEPFRCDLCGKHRRIGVTETKPKEPDDPKTGEGTQTTVCDVCVTIASDLLAGDDEHDAS